MRPIDWLPLEPSCLQVPCFRWASKAWDWLSKSFPSPMECRQHASAGAGQQAGAGGMQQGEIHVDGGGAVVLEGVVEVADQQQKIGE